MSTPFTIPLSVLDLAPISAGLGASETLRRITSLAGLADRLGFERYWFAEHHALSWVASSAPEILIAHVAAATTRLRVGSGGIMLPNHPSLRVAEVFKTLSALYPGRIDLGLGRAPGGNAGVLRALRAGRGEQFGTQLGELLAFARRETLPENHPYAGVYAEPADAPLPPIWLLGSSGASARMAGSAGFGYGFASHFSSEPPATAMLAYREAFEPSADFARPHAVLAVAVVCAPTDDEADFLTGTLDLMRLRIQSGRPQPLVSPEEVAAMNFSSFERQAIRDNRRLVVVGSPATVRAQLLAMAEETRADELMIVSNLHAQEHRLRSYELVAQALRRA